jgi:aminoglycoside phosphotransferase family enzyme/predicted kinase
MAADAKEQNNTVLHRSGFAGYSRAENERLGGLRSYSGHHRRDIGGDGGRVPIDEVALVGGLLRPEAYPWRPPAVELVETHVSWVFLAGDRVVKVKRSVDYGFVDHTTLASRRRSCLEEVRLNRRLTNGVYLDAVPIVRDHAGYLVAAEGVPVEWATLMRRLPAEGMLDALLAAGKVPPCLGDRLADRLIPFHRDSAAPCVAPESEIAAATSAVVTENLTALEAFAARPLGPVQLGLVAESLRTFSAEHADLLRKRVYERWIREGHGDLRAEHVCLEPDGEIQIFDCIEFSRDLRCADIASDLAFLLMDFDRLGLPEVAATIVTRYQAAGMDLPEALLRYYQAHRALVRAKVACLSRALAHETARDNLALQATDYLNLATATALTVRPSLIAMTGLSGTGKSTVAAALARALNAEIFASDVVRKELAGQVGSAPEAWGHGLYTTEQTEATYQRLGELATQTLAAGRTVILDATFLDGQRRERLAAVARAAGAPLVLVETVCREDTAVGRIVARTRHGGSPSDATIEVYRRQRAAAEASPPALPRGAIYILVDTDAAPQVHLEPVLTALHREDIIMARIPDPPLTFP